METQEIKMKRLILVVVAIILLASVAIADDKSTLELKQMTLQVIEARQAQWQAQMQLLQISFTESERAKAVLKDEIRLLEEKIKRAEPPKK